MTNNENPFVLYDHPCRGEATTMIKLAMRDMYRRLEIIRETHFDVGMGDRVSREAIANYADQLIMHLSDPTFDLKAYLGIKKGSF